MKEKIKALMSEKEMDIIDSGSHKNVKQHSQATLKKYIKLTRKLRDKYRDLTQRQIVANKQAHNFRTVEKAQVFDKILKRYEKRYQDGITTA